jgi:putative DNA primase/helicase
MPTALDALRYAEAGIPIFPLRGKQPIEVPGTANVDGVIIPQGSGGFHQATIDAGKIERWWQAYPDANIGTPTGHHTDAMTGQPNAQPFDVLDIDVDKGGLDSIATLIDANGALPETWYQVTGTGGHHYGFRSDGTVRNSAGGIAPGIDVRGTGGYIVVAPSIHPKTLEPYEWFGAPWASELADWPEWLRRAIKEVSQRRNGSATVGARIPLGVQEATLTRIAGAMRRQGSTEAEILAALRVVSQERCDPPVAEADTARIAKSISSYEPGEPLIDFARDDGGNAERLVNRYGDVLRHVADARQGEGWYHYDGRVWQESISKVVQYQLETARAYQEAAEAMPNPEGATAEDQELRNVRKAHMANAKLCAQERGITSARKLAATFPEIEVKRAELDANPFDFAVANGVIDMRSGELREHNSLDLITRMSPVAYDPEARSELWESYLDWLTKSRQDLKDFLQAAVGYSLTGDTREEKLFFIHGPAASGKTTFIEAVKTVLGGYAMTADFSTFLKGHDVGRARPDIARMSGARFVSSVEVDQGKRLAEGLVKQMTGGDMMVARFLYATEFEFPPTHKLWLVANDAPKVSNEDDGLWRRILRIPCDNVVPEGQRDPTLKARLRDPLDVGPAVLAWAIEGARRWHQAGKLVVPEVVIEATEAYRESQDPLTDFLAECCELGSTYKVAMADLYSAYLAYCKLYHSKPMGQRKFGEGLTAKGFETTRSGKDGGRYRMGLTLASSEVL